MYLVFTIPMINRLQFVQQGLYLLALQVNLDRFLHCFLEANGAHQLTDMSPFPSHSGHRSRTQVAEVSFSLGQPSVGTSSTVTEPLPSQYGHTLRLSRRASTFS